MILEQKFSDFKENLKSEKGIIRDCVDFYINNTSKNGETLHILNHFLRKMYSLENILDVKGDINMNRICIVAQEKLYKELRTKNFLFNFISERNLNEVSPEFDYLVKQLKFKDI